MRRGLALLTATAMLGNSFSVAFAATLPSAVHASTQYVWTVKRGDTLRKIALSTGVSIAELEKYNAISNPNMLQIGQVIDLSRMWTVTAGETLFKIAAMTKVPLYAIEQANGLTKSSELAVGETLVIPSTSITKVTRYAKSGIDSPANQWVVASGDTLWKISQATGESIQAIEQANNLSNPSDLTIGQVLTITSGTDTTVSPATTAPAAISAPANQWVVASGDTLWKISQATGESIQAIEQANNLSNPSDLTIGQVLTITSGTDTTVSPATTAPAAISAPANQWVVASGDTLWKISQATGESIQAIEQANNLSNPSDLTIGQVLTITSGTDTTVSPATTAPAAISAPTNQWVVASGDTLWKISQATGESIQAIEQANNLNNPSDLTIGQVLTITSGTDTTVSPATTAPAAISAPANQWVVASGDTLWKISQATGESIQAIEQANPSVTASNLMVGEVLTIPSAVVTPTVPIIYTWVTSMSSMNDAMAHSSINDFSNDNYSFDASGNVTDTTPGGTNTVDRLIQYSKANNMNVFATVTNWSSNYSQSSALASSVLNSSVLRTTLENNLVNIATTDDYAGIDLDIEQVSPSDQAVFTDFVDELAAKLHADGKKLSVTIPGDAGESYYSGYNLRAIGQVADLVPVMTYDYNWAGSSAGAVAPLQWDSQVMNYVTSQIPANKVLLGIGAYGYDWNSNDNTMAQMVTLNQVDNLIQTDNLIPQWDSTDSVPYLQFTDANGVSHTIYYENQTSLQDKIALVKQYGLGGIAFWQAGQENSAFWNAVN